MKIISKIFSDCCLRAKQQKLHDCVEEDEHWQDQHHDEDSHVAWEPLEEWFSSEKIGSIPWDACSGRCKIQVNVARFLHGYICTMPGE